MFENLPQLSEATRQLLGKEIDAFSKLSEPEAQIKLMKRLLS